VTADAVDEGPPKELSLQKIRSLWQSIRTRAEEVRPSLNAPLSRATLEDLDGTTLVIRRSDAAAGGRRQKQPRHARERDRKGDRARAERAGRRRLGCGAARVRCGRGARRRTGERRRAGLLDYALKTLPSST